MVDRIPIELPRQSADRVRHTTLTDLSHCEKLYALKNVDGHEFEATVPMKRGSFFHELAAAWWLTGSWDDKASELTKEWAAANPDADFLPEWMHDVGWLMGRYERMYEAERLSGGIEVLGQEVPVKVRLPGKYGWFTSYLDELWRIEGRIWILERKTMGDFTELEAFAWSPQITLYHWAAGLDEKVLELTSGEKPYGILLDAARTYRWKRDEHKHPPADSFQRRWLDRNPEHDDEAVLDAIAGLERMRALKRGARPLRNVGRHCNTCIARVPCRMQAAFGEDVVVWDDEEES